MPNQSQPAHIEITETLVRLYVFLAQYLDRCLDEKAKESLSEQALQSHLSATRESMMNMITVNPVVKGKVEKECDRILSLGKKCLQGRSTDPSTLQEIKQERSMLQHKTIALSDLLAVFRAQ